MTVDTAGLEELIRAEGARLRDAAADRVLAAVKDDCPVGQDSPTRRTAPGTLRDDLHIFETDDSGTVFTVSIGSDLDYASFTDEQDTQPHLIFPTEASKTLRFWWENGPRGAAIYNYRFVRHPGTKGQHWFASKNEDRWTVALTEVA